MTSLPVAQWATYVLIGLSAAGTAVSATQLQERASLPDYWTTVGYLAPASAADGTVTAPRIDATVAQHTLRRECSEGVCLAWLLDSENNVLDSRIITTDQSVALRMSRDQSRAVLDIGDAQSWSVLPIPRPEATARASRLPTWLAVVCALGALGVSLIGLTRAARLRAFLSRARPCTVDSHGYVRFDDTRLPRAGVTHSHVRAGPASALDPVLPSLVGYRTSGAPIISVIRAGAPMEHASRLAREAPMRHTAVALALLALVAPLAMLLA